MGIYFDFKVKYDPETDQPEDLTKRVLYSLIIRRIKARKPVVMFLSGDSGEGKSFSALRLQELLLEMQGGLSLNDYLNHINVYTPLQYPKKIDALLFDKDLKKINILCVHEARELIKAKKWHTFLSQAISDVNAMSRSVKRLCFIIISQFIRDITTDVRYTLNYYVKVSRPIGKRARLYISIMWKDDRDLEKPKLRRRRLRGYIIDNKGRQRIYEPEYLELSKPDKDVITEFEKQDFEAKAKIIRHKVDKLIQEMSVELEVENRKVDAMLTWYIDNKEHLNTIAKRYKGKWKLKPEVKIMHDLTDIEAKEFQDKLNQKLKDEGMIKKSEVDEWTK